MIEKTDRPVRGAPEHTLRFINLTPGALALPVGLVGETARDEVGEAFHQTRGGVRCLIVGPCGIEVTTSAVMDGSSMRTRVWRRLENEWALINALCVLCGFRVRLPPPRDERPYLLATVEDADALCRDAVLPSLFRIRYPVFNREKQHPAERWVRALAVLETPDRKAV